MRILLTPLMLLTLAVAAPAQAQLLEPQHDGFFLRFQVGPGYMDLRSRDFSANGPSGTFGLALGGTLAKNLILFGEVLAQAADEPNLDADGGRGFVEGTEIGYSGVGPGLTYYLPGNFYISASVIAARAQLKGPRATGVSDLGIGSRASIGKEWWVSRDWGLGLALVGDYASIPDGPGPRLTHTGLSLAFSATLN